MIKYLTLLIVYVILLALVMCFGVVLAVVMILRGIFWDHKFRIGDDFYITDFSPAYTATSVWDDLHHWWYKERGGC